MKDDHIRVRPGSIADASKVAALCRQLLSFYGTHSDVAAEEMADEIRANAFGPRASLELLLAESADQCLGIVVFHEIFQLARCRRSLFIQDLFVLEEARRIGVGERLMRALCETAQAREIDLIDWTTERGNERVIRFYARLGAEFRGEKLLYQLQGSRLERLITGSHIYENNSSSR